MRKHLFVVALFVLGCPCLPEVCPHPREIILPELRLAPGVMGADNLAFSIVYENDEEFFRCERISAFSYEADGTRRYDWKAHAPHPVRCPSFFKWGQDLGEGWEQLAAGLPLESNRLYTLRMYLEYGRGGDAEFCIFKDGSVQFHYSGFFDDDSFYRKERIKACMEEA